MSRRGQASAHVTFAIVLLAKGSHKAESQIPGGEASICALGEAGHMAEGVDTGRGGVSSYLCRRPLECPHYFSQLAT